MGTAKAHPNSSESFEYIRMETKGPKLVLKELSYRIIGAFFDVYNELGFGYLESVYVAAMAVALDRAGLRVEREVPVTIFYRGVEVGHHRLDMLVERLVILEIKSTERVTDIPRRQVRNYLSATGLELGMLLHFGPTAQFHRILRPPKGQIIARSKRPEVRKNLDDSEEFG